jgi:hypothetical protein
MLCHKGFTIIDLKVHLITIYYGRKISKLVSMQIDK